MLKVAAKDGVFSVTELFRNEKLGAQIPHPILHDGHLYLQGNWNFRKDGLICMDLAGNVKWKTERNPALDRGHLMLAEGRLYTLDGAAGKLRAIAPDPTGYKELASAPIFTGKDLWAPLVLSDGRLLVRGKEELRCLDLRAQ
jgi:hypothetical protein